MKADLDREARLRTHRRTRSFTRRNPGDDMFYETGRELPATGGPLRTPCERVAAIEGDDTR